MPYERKEVALAAVRVAAGEYFTSRTETEERHDALAQTIRDVKREFPRVTQEELAEETDFTYVQDNARLSRQRVQQILQETP